MRKLQLAQKDASSAKNPQDKKMSKFSLSSIRQKGMDFIVLQRVFMLI